MFTSILEMEKAAYQILNEVALNFEHHADRLDIVRIEGSRRLTVSAGKAWSFGIRDGLIRLSWSIFGPLGEEYRQEFRETVLHEIAHVLTPGERHSYVWRRVLLEIGGNGRRTHSLPTPDRKPTEPVACLCGRDLELGPRQIVTHRKGLERGLIIYSCPQCYEKASKLNYKRQQEGVTQ